MSLRLLDDWQFQSKTTHTAADDMVSFLWVFIHALLFLSREIGELTQVENRWMEVLNKVDNLKDMVAQKGDLLQRLVLTSTTQFSKKHSPPLPLFRELLQSWTKTAASIRNEISDALEDDPQMPVAEMEVLSKGYYRQYLDIGYAFLAILAGCLARNCYFAIAYPRPQPLSCNCSSCRGALRRSFMVRRSVYTAGC
jgi:hypothetical protein